LLEVGSEAIFVAGGMDQAVEVVDYWASAGGGYQGYSSRAQRLITDKGAALREAR
jgi:hypothetical protein